jgi:molybdopterin-biosynthesis enzyme MoeA-like protein
LLAFRLADERADAVIVNGGLGPTVTVDDLSQEIGAREEGFELELNNCLAPCASTATPIWPRRTDTSSVSPVPRNIALSL